MCEAKPALRCKTDAYKDLAKANKAWLDAKENPDLFTPQQVTMKERVLKRRLRDWEITSVHGYESAVRFVESVEGQNPLYKRQDAYSDELHHRAEQQKLVNPNPLNPAKSEDLQSGELTAQANTSFDKLPPNVKAQLERDKKIISTYEELTHNKSEDAETYFKEIEQEARIRGNISSYFSSITRKRDTPLLPEQNKEVVEMFDYLSAKPHSRATGRRPLTEAEQKMYTEAVTRLEAGKQLTVEAEAKADKTAKRKALREQAHRRAGSPPQMDKTGLPETTQNRPPTAEEVRREALKKRLEANRAAPTKKSKPPKGDGDLDRSELPPSTQNKPVVKTTPTKRTSRDGDLDRSELPPSTQYKPSTKRPQVITAKPSPSQQKKVEQPNVPAPTPKRKRGFVSTVKQLFGLNS